MKCPICNLEMIQTSKKHDNTGVFLYINTLPELLYTVIEYTCIGFNKHVIAIREQDLK